MIATSDLETVSQIETIDDRLVDLYLTVYSTGKTKNLCNKINQYRQKRQKQVENIQDTVLLNRHRFLPDRVLVLMKHIATKSGDSVELEKLSKVFVDNMVISISISNDNGVVTRNDLYKNLIRVYEVSTRFGFKVGTIVMYNSALYLVTDILSPQKSGDSTLILRQQLDKNLRCNNSTVVTSELNCVLGNEKYKQVLAEHSNTVRKLTIDHSEALIKLKTDVSNRIFDSIKA